MVSLVRQLSDCLMCSFEVKNNWIKESMETNQLKQC